MADALPGCGHMCLSGGSHSAGRYHCVSEVSFQIIYWGSTLSPCRGLVPGRLGPLLPPPRCLLKTYLIKKDGSAPSPSHLPHTLGSSCSERLWSSAPASHRPLHSPPLTPLQGRPSSAQVQSPCPCHFVPLHYRGHQQALALGSWPGGPVRHALPAAQYAQQMSEQNTSPYTDFTLTLFSTIWVAGPQSVPHTPNIRKELSLKEVSFPI